MILTRTLPQLLRNRRFLRKESIILNGLNRWKSGREVGLSKTNSEIDTNVKPLGEKVKETTKTASYLGVILLGIGVTGTLFYAVFNELFSSNSPNNVYSKTVEICKNDSRIQDKLGLPIKAFGYETRRGRRQHAQHVVFQRDNRQCLRMKFYLQGSFHKGTANLEMCQNDSGKYEYRYLFVQVDDMLRNTIILEDNRDKFDRGAVEKTPQFDLGL